MGEKVSNEKIINPNIFPTMEEIFGWIEGFTKFPHRRTGTAEGLKSAEYVKNMFESFGLEKVEIEEEPSMTYQTEEYSLKVDGINMPCFFINGVLRQAEEGTFEIGARGIQKEVIYMGEGRKKDFEGIDVRDKIVVCDCPWFDSSEDVYEKQWCKGDVFVYDPKNIRGHIRNKKDSYSPNAWPYNYFYACQGGAAGFVGVLVDYFDDGISYNEDYTEMGKKYGYDYMEIGGLWVGKSTGEKIKKILRESLVPVIGDISQKNIYKRRSARNIHGVLPGKSKEIILVHSHHDAVFTGAVQDASGMSEVFALAKYFSQIPLEMRNKTLMFAGLDSHYTDYMGHQGFLKKRKDCGDSIVLDVVIEHIGKEVELGPKNEPVVTGEVEMRILYITNNKQLIDIAKDAIIRNGIERVFLFPVNPKSLKKDGENYEFKQDEVISDAYYSHNEGIKIISMLSPQMYLFHPMDTLEMIPKEQLRPVGIAFAEIIQSLMPLDL